MPCQPAQRRTKMGLPAVVVWRSDEGRKGIKATRRLAVPPTGVAHDSRVVCAAVLYRGVQETFLIQGRWLAESGLLGWNGRSPLCARDRACWRRRLSVAWRVCTRWRMWLTREWKREAPLGLSYYLRCSCLSCWCTGLVGLRISWGSRKS